LQLTSAVLPIWKPETAWLPKGLVLALLAAAGARVVAVWDRLPERMASHFGASGQPDGFTSPQGFFGTMALLGGGVVVSLLVLPALLRYCPPQLINLPNRDYWLAPERRAASIRRLGVWLSWFAFATGALLCFALELTIRANLEQRALDGGAFLAGTGVYFASVIALLVLLYRSFAT
jgi:hypothetical protein